MAKKQASVDDLEVTPAAGSEPATTAPATTAPAANDSDKPAEPVADKPKGPRPTVCRNVHYHPEENSKPMAAMITDVSEEKDGQVGLVLFDPRGDTRYKLNVPFSAKPGVGGHWNWPPKG